MMDELMDSFHVFNCAKVDDSPELPCTCGLDKALTAIYEIGLGVIEAGKPEPRIADADIETIREDLRASQRKAWAKACGVDNVDK